METVDTCIALVEVRPSKELVMQKEEKQKGIKHTSLESGKLK